MTECHHKLRDPTANDSMRFDCGAICQFLQINLIHISFDLCRIEIIVWLTVKNTPILTYLTLVLKSHANSYKTVNKYIHYLHKYNKIFIKFNYT